MKFCDTDENASLADLFEALEKLKGEVIESYTVLGSASLDTGFWIRYIYWIMFHFIL